MIHLLDNYINSARTRYEAHTLIYTPENAEPIYLPHLQPLTKTYFRIVAKLSWKFLW